ncbi:MAG: M48 family metalloprotease [Armatimonadota bacterium]
MKPLTHARGSLYALMAVLVAAALAAAPARAVTLEEELELGRKLDAEILKQTPQISDKQALKEIDELGQQLVKGVQRPQIKYHFRILRGDDLNAFSIPGGYVYFSEHLWNVLRRDERIGVLAHEIVHSDRRHALDAILKAQRRQIWISLILAAARANRTWSDIADILHQVYTLKYSRGDERQADEVGVELCQKAGFNPAGLLLAMRKIRRFQAESGGEPPKIFSSHPPTPEREQYLTRLLQSKGVPIPPEDVKEIPNPYKIGEVVAVEGQQIKFTSSKPLQQGSVVWLMGWGWDYYYENRKQTPIARAVVTNASSPYIATVRFVSPDRASEITKGAGVYMPPAPKPEDGVGYIRPAAGAAGDVGRLELNSPVSPLQRFLARQVVWNKDYSRLVYANAGYVVVTSAADNRPAAFLSVSRPEYSYAPLTDGAILVKLNDPDQKRWYGPVVSIGRSSQMVELISNRSPDLLVLDRSAGKEFDIVVPPWDPAESYESRVIGRAILRSLDKKIVLQITRFTPGWSMSDVRNGYDIYESLPPKDEKTAGG